MGTKQEALLVRREYNKWVANETLEDYALRYTAKTARRWSNLRVANTALGIVSFLALEAIGGAITLNYGFSNAMWAILVVSAIIFLSGLPICHYAAKYGLDIDLLTRGAGFGYMGSTISSLIYASFTFIFFALEAAIMSMAIHLISGIPLALAYVVSALAVIPLVTHGIRRISQFQGWTQPIWLIMQLLPLIFIGINESSAIAEWTSFRGTHENGADEFNLIYFGAAAAVIFPLIAQNGEQADFLRFLPETRNGRKQWWTAVVLAGPGWVIIGMIKLFIGSFLAVLALRHGMALENADDPTHMYSVAFSYITANPHTALWLAGVFVIISQLKINVTNAYAGSIAWGNFFSRLTHNHPGRVVWLLFNVSIALLLMELGLYQAFEEILITYSTLVVAWFGALVADLVINKPLGLSPKHIEFRRSHLFDINPVGVGSMLIASSIGIAANFGVFGVKAEALAAFMALLTPFITAPLIAWITRGRYYLCRHEDEEPAADTHKHQCKLCENSFDAEDTSTCPSYSGHICSLCCSLDARCGNLCRPKAHFTAQTSALFSKIFPERINWALHSVTGHFLGIFGLTGLIIAGLLSLVYFAQSRNPLINPDQIGSILWQVFFLLLLITGILIWLYVLAQKSARFALNEAQMHAELLENEVNAHKATALKLKQAKDEADAANSAKSRYLSGVSHELRTPLNTIYGYAQLMEANTALAEKERKIATVIRRSGSHLSDVIEGLLEISKIEARKLEIHRDKVPIRQLIEQLSEMFRPIAGAKGIAFDVHYKSEPPTLVAADEKRLRQVLLNLISNAIKFTPRGKVQLDIFYRNEVARFTVTDTGVGIAREDQEKIFEPFVRLFDNRTQNVTGTGLGLSITKLLVDLMGGNIEIQSEPGKGSRFIFSILLPGVTGDYDEEVVHTPITGYQGRRRTIMVVDNEPTHRQLIHDFLEPMDFNVIDASSGQDCLDIIAYTSVDLFLLDISMPVMNGWELSEKIQAQNPSTPIMMLSAEPFEDVSRHPSYNRHFAYIGKPVRINILLNRIRTALDLQWIYHREEEPGSPQEPTPQSVPVTNSELLQEILQFARIGYLSGVVEIINEMEGQNHDRDWTTELRKLSEQCDLDGIMTAVQNRKHDSEN